MPERPLSVSGCALEPTGDGEHTPRGRPWSTPGETSDGVRIANGRLTNVGAGLREFDPRLPVVRDLVLERCALRASWIRLVVIAESRLDFERTSQLNLFGVLFDRTVVTGSLGSVIVQDYVDAEHRRDPAFDALRRDFYARVPWALDLREARFGSSMELRNIPGTKCILDPATQGVAWRAPTVAAIRAGKLRDDHPWWPRLHHAFDARDARAEPSDYDDIALVVPRGSQKRQLYQQGLDDLRAKGIVR